MDAGPPHRGFAPGNGPRAAEVPGSRHDVVLNIVTACPASSREARSENRDADGGGPPYRQVHPRKPDFLSALPVRSHLQYCVPSMIDQRDRMSSHNIENGTPATHERSGPSKALKRVRKRGACGGGAILCIVRLKASSSPRCFGRTMHRVDPLGESVQKAGLSREPHSLGKTAPKILIGDRRGFSLCLQQSSSDGRAVAGSPQTV
jgi:hypothetical protein